MTKILKRCSGLLITAMVFMTMGSTIGFGQAQEIETTTSVTMTAQLIELSSTETPTTIIVRKNPDGEFVDYTVDINSSTDISVSAMDEWITGDLLFIKGRQNDNTSIVTATHIQNLSFGENKFTGLNGWISEISEDGSSMMVEWAGVQHSVLISDNTRLVVPPNVHATIEDFQVGDRVRVRKHWPWNSASIIVVLRRGDDIFLKARTRGFTSTLEEMVLDEKYMTVRLGENPHLGSLDVNNLVGVPDELVTVTWDEQTNFVRRYSGKATPEEFFPGDSLFVVGRVGDDGIIHARLIRDNDIQNLNVARQTGVVRSIDTDANSIDVVLKSEGGRRAITVFYDGETVIEKNGEATDESGIVRGDAIKVRGTYNRTTQSVDADAIALRGALFRPIIRERALKDIVKHRIRASLGLVDPTEVVEHQAGEQEFEHLSENEAHELEVEIENELELDDDHSGGDDTEKVESEENREDDKEDDDTSGDDSK